MEHYKKIAEIHKKHLDLLLNCALFSEADKQLIKNQFRVMAIDKADYFEKQQYRTGVYIPFDKKQFLKDCGVEE